MDLEEKQVRQTRHYDVIKTFQILSKPLKQIKKIYILAIFQFRNGNIKVKSLNQNIH